MTFAVEKLDAGGYRKFGLVTGAIILVLFGLLIPWVFDFNYPKWPWILAGLLWGCGLLAPMFLQPVYVVWMKFGHVMNWINTRLILGILFYGMLLPVGVLLKLAGKDPMHRKLYKGLPSYRVQSDNDSKENVERPY